MSSFTSSAFWRSSTRSVPWTSTSIGVWKEKRTGRTTRAEMSGIPAIRRRSRAITSSSTRGSEVSRISLKRAVCSPSSERWEVAGSKPRVRRRASMCSRSARMASSSGVRTAAVSSSGVPTGSWTSKVNSPWCTSGRSSLSRWTATRTVSAIEPSGDQDHDHRVPQGPADGVGVGPSRARP